MNRFLTIFLLTVSCSAFSQDLHLTQYLTSNQTLNPALTGYHDGDYRMTLNHRNQWRQLPSPMVTNQFSVEKRIQHYNKEFGLGVVLVNDDVNDLNLVTNKVALSGAYQINKNNHLIRVGLQGGLSFRQTDFESNTFPEQWNYSLGVFDANQSNNEISIEQSDMYFDVSSGASWTKRFNKWKLNAGFAAYHLNRPKNGFTNGEKSLRLPVRKIAHFRADYFVSDRFTIIPSLLYMFTTKTKDLMVGVLGNMQLSTDVSLGVGLSYRGEGFNSDALVPTIMFGYKRFDFGFSNDFNLSNLSSSTSQKTSYEISIFYTTPSVTSSRATIPCERI